jgi:immune inhibitor A
MKSANNAWVKWLILGILAIVIVCCCCAVLTTYFGARSFIDGNWQKETLAPEDTQAQVITDMVEPDDAPVDELLRTYDTLPSAIIPPADPTDLAFRLGRKPNLDRRKTDPPAQLQVGKKETFWVFNQETNEIISKDATLRMISPHVYFWVQDGKVYNSRDLEKLVNTFEDQIYPSTRRIFGKEWEPGVDNDEHIYILYTDGVGDGIAGLFSSDDSLLKAVNSYSNEHEMFYLSENQDLSAAYTYGVLAHEFNHMILWNQDVNEDTWVAEGLADLALFIGGYNEGGFDRIFSQDPDIQLNTWPEESEAQDAHYGASFLFTTYLFSRFGEKFIQEIMTTPENGLEGIQAVLSRMHRAESSKSNLESVEQVFGDWAVANYFNITSLENGRYSYSTDYRIPSFPDTENSDCPADWQPRTVHQFGTDYIRLNCNGDLTLEIQGDSTVNLIQGLEEDGNHFFWSNRADSSQTSFTREFDLPEGMDSIWLDYRVWYDLEEGFDYGYLMVKMDDSNWKILDTPSCSSDDPVGANLGCGYTGSSGGWLEERVDLSRYAGKKITLQFISLTDSAVNNQGILIDDIEIPVLEYQADFESGNGGWDAKGWSVVQNKLPQTFEISIIHNGESPSVERFSLTEGQTLNTGIKFQPGEDVTLVVSGTTRYITTPANYRFRFTPTP